MNKKSLILEIIIFISSVYGVFFASNSLDFMKLQKFLYYTIESNIFILIITFIFIVLKLLKVKIPNYLYVIKYICTVGIMITFLVFAFILIPGMNLSDSKYLFTLANMTVHVISPVIALIDFVLYDNVKFNKKTSILATLMPIFYAIFIIILVNLTKKTLFGAQKFPYFFMDYENNGWFTLTSNFMKLGTFYWAIIIWLMTYLIGIIFLKLNQMCKKKTNRYVILAIIIIITLVAIFYPII